MKIPLLSKPGDGPVSLLINRRVSGVISPRLVKRVTPCQATAMALMVGALSMLFYAFRYWAVGGILLQLSSIFSGVDGEIARLRRQCSVWGDIFDTLMDRLVEYLAIIGMTYGLYQALGNEVVWCGMLLLGGTFLLTTASEKFRSATGKNYPKQEFESYLAWITAGRDARIFILALGSVFAMLSPWVLFGVIIGLAGICHINMLLRLFVIKSRVCKLV